MGIGYTVQWTERQESTELVELTLAFCVRACQRPSKISHIKNSSSSQLGAVDRAMTGPCFPQTISNDTEIQSDSKMSPAAQSSGQEQSKMVQCMISFCLVNLCLFVVYRESVRDRLH